MTKCLLCGATRIGNNPNDGWKVEEWPTFGGDIIAIILCFGCRGLIPDDSELDHSTPRLDLGVIA